ncbi:hypothetical protein TspCOW1_30300 [Thiohalobacter sp. COW1]|uniref:Ribonuclease BN n=1 Tax=Thiohalobacter thiocyanaticus TaxID=585455 RepID=A0A1Z4VU40_9GAMM|nr:MULTISPECIES: YihY/virulence factor BrkB family protein [Thiohalobacter]BAZ95146.1 ribonuclease BN [Thiohalobacter thiocyanaticus]BCO32927.1 hypothetical protein TspCOW1_30300 [Thiohalobacter sp. COW1]
MYQLNEVITRLNGLVWEDDLRSLSPLRRILIRSLRLLYVMVRDFLSGDLTLRAMSLVYTTLLSLVPLLAVSFSVLKGFGVHKQIEPLLYGFLEPLGPKGSEVAAQIMTFVDNVKGGVLGGIGLLLLVYTVLSLLKKIEGSFNFVWRVEQLRPFAQRFSNYLSVILIGPLLIISALGMTASVMNTGLMQQLMAIEPFGTLIVLATKLVPYVLIWVAFTFIYIFIPNVRVRFGAAAIAALLAGFLWQTTGWVFASFIASSTKYAAIYSSFAILVMLLIWLYINWLVLLLGAQLAFYIQNPQYLTRHRVRLLLSNRLKERLALTVMYLAGENHFHNRPPWTLTQLCDHLNLPAEPLNQLLEVLLERGFLVATASEIVGYVPARDIETIRLDELLNRVREAGESHFVRPGQVPALQAVDGLMEELQGAQAAHLDGMTLRDLVVQRQPAR